MALLGLILIAFGITDFAMSWMGTDVWADGGWVFNCPTGCIHSPQLSKSPLALNF